MPSHRVSCVNVDGNRVAAYDADGDFVEIDASRFHVGRGGYEIKIDLRTNSVDNGAPSYGRWVCLDPKETRELLDQLTRVVRLLEET